MKFYSTNNHNNLVNLKEAVLNAFPKDRGLYLPCKIPIFTQSELAVLYEQDFQETAFIVCKKLLEGAIEDKALKKIIYTALNFPLVQKQLDNRVSILELFHGPSLAFKDFGARFMAELMSYLLKENHEKRTILVATSGDTGGAVAAGFYGVENINVVILYPSGKVSPLQEKQLTTWESNIKAVEVSGSFDDCQRMVKDAFVDKELNEKYTFSSANSINIARLIPQMFYFFEAYKLSGCKKLSVVVPSGNFGNITAGILAARMGLDITHFIAANNKNKTFVDFYNTGIFNPRPSKSSISNAMDVGDPSNFPRLFELLGSTWNKVKDKMRAYSYTDDETCYTIKDTYEKFNYLLDPHTAVGLLAAREYSQENDEPVCILSTAHPAKFEETIYSCAKVKPSLPPALKEIINKDKVSVKLSNNFADFKQHLMLSDCST